jgi:D-glycero-D-manno-heptose 1,7-bisphosphate phosphatase
MPEGTTVDFHRIRFVFLDRDGIINRKAPSGAYVTSWEEFHIIPGVEQAIASLNQTRRKVMVVTNQRAIALGKISESELLSIHEKLASHLRSFEARIDAIYYCPHDIGQCDCRKPKTGLFQRAFGDYHEASSANSVMIGDSYSDMKAGASMGMKTILITDGSPADSAALELADASARSLLEAVESYLHGSPA